jgi:proton-translocating NADH-quinone oxidoreductase chain N
VLTLFVLIPLFVLLLLNLSWRSLPPTLPLLCVLAIGFANVVFGLALPTLALDQQIPILSELHFGLVADDLTRVFLVSIGLVVCAAALVNHESKLGENANRNFCSLLLVSLTGMNGVVLLSDFFTLYVFLEVAGIASFILIAFGKNVLAVEGAFRYLLLSAVAGMFMLSGVGLLLYSVGGTSFAAVHGVMASAAVPSMAKLGIALYIIGLFIKGGLVPFHGWLPGAYSSAPAGVSVLLAGIVTKVSGIYALVRLSHDVITPEAGLSTVFLVAGSVSIVVGALAAIGQSDLKRMLAYSSISQVGYIVLALGSGTQLGLVAATFHLFNHAIFKSMLFVDSAAVESSLGTTDMNRMGGVGAKMPWTGTTTGIAMLSAAGIPPFSGFWSKLLIVVALYRSNHEGYATLAVVASVLTLGYFLVMQQKAFFGKPSANVEGAKEAGPGYIVPAVALALITILTGVFFPLLKDGPLAFLLLNKGLTW